MVHLLGPLEYFPLPVKHECEVVHTDEVVGMSTAQKPSSKCYVSLSVR